MASVGLCFKATSGRLYLRLMEDIGDDLPHLLLREVAGMNRLLGRVDAHSPGRHSRVELVLEPPLLYLPEDKGQGEAGNAVRVPEVHRGDGVVDAGSLRSLTVQALPMAVEAVLLVEGLAPFQDLGRRLRYPGGRLHLRHPVGGGGVDGESIGGRGVGGGYRPPGDEAHQQGKGQEDQEPQPAPQGVIATQKREELLYGTHSRYRAADRAHNPAMSRMKMKVPMGRNALKARSLCGNSLFASL